MTIIHHDPRFNEDGSILYDNYYIILIPDIENRRLIQFSKDHVEIVKLAYQYSIPYMISTYHNDYIIQNNQFIANNYEITTEDYFHNCYNIDPKKYKLFKLMSII